MASNRLSKSIFRSIVVGGSLVTLALLPTGCSDSKNLSKDQAQGMVSKYVNSRSGSVSSIQGVMQNENTNEAVATVELNNLRYSSSGGSDGTYTGKAIANFSRYTDGTWSMTRVTINPDNLFSAKWFDTDVKAPTFVETQMELINKPLVDRGYNTLPPSLVIAILSIPIVGVALLILKDFSNRKTPQSR